ncbi:MAG TPA: hypothetical protein VH369_26160 [Bryobacteraceae bacterium]|jgi:hypothetical protein
MTANADIAGSIFLTGHDPDYHSFAGGNTSGAAAINTAAINFVTDPAFNPFANAGIKRFLYVTSNIAPPAGHVDGTNGLLTSGYVLGVDFDRADAATLVTALGRLGTTYDALVIASDFGGILTQAELNILNAHSPDIINFLNQGGGLYAMAESDLGAGLTPGGGLFGYLPFVIASAQKDQNETGDTVTSFGASIGLSSTDLNGNASHNIFTATSGLNIVDLDSSGAILSLAGRGKVTDGGVSVVPEPADIFLFATGLFALLSSISLKRLGKRVPFFRTGFASPRHLPTRKAN